MKGKLLVSIIFLMLFSIVLVVVPYHDVQNYRKVGRLYPSDTGYFFTLKGGKTDINPKNDYYLIHRTHKNYEAITDLLFRAEEQGWKISVRTEESLDSNDHARVM
jgi:hypothetical protein